MTNPSAIEQLAEGEKTVVTKEVADNTAVEAAAGKLSDVSSHQGCRVTSRMKQDCSSDDSVG
jgi:hypothetical protein